MKRILFSTLAGISGLLFLAVAGVWVRSFFQRDMVSFVTSKGNGQLIQSIRGRLHIISELEGRSSGAFLHRVDRLSPDAVWNGAMSGYPVKVEWRLGHVWQHYTRQLFPLYSGFGGSPFILTHHRLIVVPYWSPALLFGILPTIWTWRFVKSGHRRKLGHCPRCNYDLRATPQRCPECGWTAAGL